jgi:hypothetical protein
MIQMFSKTKKSAADAARLFGVHHLQFVGFAPGRSCGISGNKGGPNCDLLDRLSNPIAICDVLVGYMKFVF